MSAPLVYSPVRPSTPNAVWNRLHQHARTKRAKIIQNEHRRPKHCSFQPKLVAKQSPRAQSATTSKSKNEPGTFARLYGRARKIEKKKLDVLKRRDERNPRGCTFRPYINHRQADTKNDGLPKTHIFDRLYFQGVDRLKKREQTAKRRPRNCTFSPRTLRPVTIGGQQPSRRRYGQKPPTYEPFHVRLYKEGQARQKRHYQKHKHASLGRDYTFKPAINVKSRKITNGRHQSVQQDQSPESPSRGQVESQVFCRLYKAGVEHHRKMEQLSQRRPQFNFSPTLSPKSRRIMKVNQTKSSMPETEDGLSLEEKYQKRRKKTNFGEKLYQDAQRRMQKQEKQRRMRQSKKEFSFTPQINKQGSPSWGQNSTRADFGNRLYEEGKQRLKRREQNMLSMQKKFSFSPRTNQYKSSGGKSTSVTGKRNHGSGNNKRVRRPKSFKRPQKNTAHYSSSDDDSLEDVDESDDDESDDDESDSDGSEAQRPLRRKANSTILQAYDRGKTSQTASKRKENAVVNATKVGEIDSFGKWDSEKIDQELDMFNMLQTSPTEKTGTVQRTEESIDRLSQLKEIEEAAKSKRAKELQEKRYRH